MLKISILYVFFQTLYNKTGEHLNTTKINWNNTQTEFEVTDFESESSAIVEKRNIFYADIDGSSKQKKIDVNYVSDFNTQIAINNEYTIQNFESKYYHVNKGDFDGDGKEEILIVVKKETNKGNKRHFYLCDNLEDEAEVIITEILDEKIDSNLEVADFNGDGNADFLFRHNNYIYIYEIINNVAVEYKNHKVKRFRRY